MCLKKLFLRRLLLFRLDICDDYGDGGMSIVAVHHYQFGSCGNFSPEYLKLPVYLVHTF